MKASEETYGGLTLPTELKDGTPTQPNSLVIQVLKLLMAFGRYGFLTAQVRQTT